MNSRKIMLISMITAVMVFSVRATTTATSNYYKLDCPKTDVGVFTDVTITAKSNDWRVDKVIFYWYSPNGLEFTQTVYITQVGNERVASSTHKVDTLGEWTVKAVFKGGDDTWWTWCDDVCKVKCCVFNVIPEVPLIGTAGASLVMFAGLAYWMKRKAARKDVP
jgi:hypothetical protein